MSSKLYCMQIKSGDRFLSTIHPSCHVIPAQLHNYYYSCELGSSTPFSEIEIGILGIANPAVIDHWIAIWIGFSLTLNIQFKVGHARLSKSVVSRTDIDSRVVSGDSRVGQRQAPNIVFATGHLPLFSVPRHLGGRVAPWHLTGQGDGVTGFGHDDAVVGDGSDLGLNWKKKCENISWLKKM
jgi:hypothetical protein